MQDKRISQIVADDQTAATDDSLLKIRALLFGQFQQETQQQLDSLKQQLHDQHEALSSEIQARMRRLEESLLLRVDQLDAGLLEARQQSHAGDEELSAQLAAQEQTLLAELNRAASDAADDLHSLSVSLREQLQEQAAAGEQRAGRLATEIRQRLDSIDTRKLDRQGLASLLTQMAGQLSAEPSDT